MNGKNEENQKYHYTRTHLKHFPLSYRKRIPLVHAKPN